MSFIIYRAQGKSSCTQCGQDINVDEKVLLADDKKLYCTRECYYLATAEDHTLTADQLDDKYNPEGDGEHPKFTRESWRRAVAGRDTICGYWEWVACKLHEDSVTQTGELGCAICGEAMFITDTGVAHHYLDDAPDNIDHDADADHVALADEDEEESDAD